MDEWKWWNQMQTEQKDLSNNITTKTIKLPESRSFENEPVYPSVQCLLCGKYVKVPFYGNCSIICEECKRQWEEIKERLNIVTAKKSSSGGLE